MQICRIRIGNLTLYYQMKKPATPHGYWLFVGGDGGIRTHVPLRTTAFRVRLVMTTSIRLHIIRLACILRDFRKHKLNYTTNFAHLQAKFLIIVIITLLYSFPNYYRHLPLDISWHFRASLIGDFLPSVLS